MNVYQLFLTYSLGLSIALTAPVSADDDEHRGGRKSSALPSVDNALYKQECSGCHMAYQPGFLPERSWRKLMAGLDNHFGDNAELGAKERSAIEAYLVENSGDRVENRRTRRFVKSVSASETPLRISELRYFQKEHREIPERMIKGNDKVKSLAQCNACHQQAEQGSYSERQIRIPGYGRWED